MEKCFYGAIEAIKKPDQDGYLVSGLFSVEDVGAFRKEKRKNLSVELWGNDDGEICAHLVETGDMSSAWHLVSEVVQFDTAKNEFYLSGWAVEFAGRGMMPRRGEMIETGEYVAKFAVGEYFSDDLEALDDVRGLYILRRIG